MLSRQAPEPSEGPSMTLHMSTTAALALTAAVCAGLVIYRWGAHPEHALVPPQRGDLAQAITAAAAVGALVFALLTPPGTASGGSDQPTASPARCQSAPASTEH